MEIMASISSSAHHHNPTFGLFCPSSSSTSSSFRFSRHQLRTRSLTKTLRRNGRQDTCRIPRSRDAISRTSSINYSLRFWCSYYTGTSNERYEDNLYGDHIPSHNLEVLMEIRRNTSSSMRMVAGKGLPLDAYNKKYALETWSKETETLRLAKQKIHGNGGARCQVNGDASNYSANVSPHYSKIGHGITLGTDFDENKIPALSSGSPLQDPLEHSCQNLLQNQHTNANAVVQNATSEINKDKAITQVNGSTNSHKRTVVDSPRSVKRRPNFSMYPRNISKAVRTSRLEDIYQNHVKTSLSYPSLQDQVNGVGVQELEANEVELAETVILPQKSDTKNIHDELRKIYDDVLIVDDISVAKDVVQMLTHEYKHLIHACDTEVAKIDVKQETPVDHGEITCFSIYSGPNADFGHGKSCIWVDVLDGGGKDLLLEFAPFFEDPSIKKIWHNYSFDNHIIENYGIKLSGFHADTMHMARLWDSSRRTEGGYSLEALTGDHRVMAGAKLGQEKEVLGKISMKTIFGKKKVKKDGSEGKMITLASVEELQREERELWICYSALDAISTLKLYESLRNKLSTMAWKFQGAALPGKSMFDFYRKYWQPFGEILVEMESEGMLVDREYLAKIEKQAKAEQEVAANRFRNWASKYCPDAKYMNVGSDTQLRQLLFGGTLNRKDQNESLPVKKVFKVPNTDGYIEEGKKTALKYRNITLHCITDVPLPTEMYTATGWPSVSGDALKILAGKVSAEYDFQDDFLNPDSVDNDEEACELKIEKVSQSPESKAGQNVDISAYGTAYRAFRYEEAGREACHAIAALCEVCSIDSLISNFILPLQGDNVSGKNGRVHCSLNINTETGRLSARRPNLQNQPALEKDRYKIRQAFIAAPGNSLIVADYGQLELRILAHLADCKSMLDAFEAGGDFHSRTALNMYQHIQDAVEKNEVLLEWHPQPGEDKPPVPLIKDAFGSERRKAKMLNFSIAYGKTPIGLARDWKVSVEEAKETVDLWYKERQEVLIWQENRKAEARREHRVHTLLGRARRFPSLSKATRAQRSHIERAAINTPVQGSAADVAMCAMLAISKNKQLKEMGWRLLLQVHDEVILEGPTKTAEIAKAIVVECMSKPFNGKNILKVGLAVDAKCAQNWYAAK